LPRLDRPLRFSVQRGRHPPLMADTISDLQALLRRSPKASDQDDRFSPPQGGRRRGQRGGHRNNRHGRRHNRPRG
jgi:hypothetical protein